MTFLAPFMLWGAAAAAVPIVLHFFFRSRYRRVPWAAMRFLLVSIEQTSRRLRFQELLLLAARISVLVLLALALARPSGKSAPVASEAVDAVLVVDNSYSMDAREGRITRLEQARQAARRIIDHLPPHSTVQVITCADRAALLGPRQPSDFDRARDLIDGIQLSHLSTDFLPGITAAAQALDHSQAGSKELYLLSDMQKTGWESRAAELESALRALHQKATVYLVRCGQHTPRNATVVGIVPQSGIPHTGERAAFAVLVRNGGTETIRNLTVTLTVDGNPSERESQPVPELAPGHTQAVPLTAKLTRPGLRIFTATVGPDELDADNRFDQVIRVHEQVRALVVDGGLNEQEPEKSPSFFLMHALSPVKESDRPAYYVQPQLVPPRQAFPALLGDKDLCILVNINLKPGPEDRLGRLPRDFLDGLSAFVRAGHGLIVFSGDHVAAGPYNKLLYRQQGLLPVELRDKLVTHDQQPIRINRSSADGPIFSVFREDEVYKELGSVEVRQHLAVRDSTPTGSSAGAVQVLLRYTDGAPAVVSRRVEAGESLFVTTSADLSWSDWPLWRGMYLPFVDLMLNRLLHSQAQQHNLVAGAPLRWRPRDRDAGRGFVCIHPDGERERLGLPDLVAGQPLVTAPDTPLAGIYRIGVESEAAHVTTVANRNAARPVGVPFAVVPDLRESEDLQSLGDAQIDSRLGFAPVHVLATDDMSKLVGSDRVHHEWTLWLLAGVLLLLLMESGLAWLCGRAW